MIRLRLSDIALSVLLVLSAASLWIHSTGLWKMDRMAAIVGWVTPFLAGMVVGIQKERRRSQQRKAKLPVRSQPSQTAAAPSRSRSGSGPRKRSQRKADSAV